MLLLAVGALDRRRGRWIAAGLVTAAAVAAQFVLSPPRIEEGHNLFVTGNGAGSAIFERELPPEVFRFMAAEFDKAYPLDQRCNTGGCWKNTSVHRLFAFSADGIYDRPQTSRRVTSIDFDDPTWLRLGFTNDLQYNWYNHESDVQRGHRDPRPWAFFHRWKLTMPWFVVYRFPEDFAGGRLCWRGDVFWEGGDGRFAHEHHADKTCRTLQRDDIGRRIFGIAVKPAALAMTLEPPAGVAALQWANALLKLAGVGALLLLLVRVRLADLRLPLFLLALAAVLILLSDASLFGGFRYHDGGDDGLAYEGWGRQIVQHLLAGNVYEALRGGESVFYFTPGMRYFRALERFLFGETNFGYLGLLLMMPFLVWGLLRRFLPASWTLVLTLLFFLTPAGLLFGTNFFLYVQNASRGYADAAAAIVLLAATLLLVGRPGHDEDRARFSIAFLAALLMALAVQLRPNLAPAAGVLLGGAGLVALWGRQVPRLAGLCIGFVPIGLCALHNWVYGGVFVPFSSNATHDSVFKIAPSDYGQALVALLSLSLADENLARVVRMAVDALTGPRQWLALVPLHAAALAVALRVIASRRYDCWLRLVALAALAGIAVAFFYVATPRYYLMLWFFVAVVMAVWLRAEGIALLTRCAPGPAAALSRHPLMHKLARLLDKAQAALGVREGR